MTQPRFKFLLRAFTFATAATLSTFTTTAMANSAQPTKSQSETDKPLLLQYDSSVWVKEQWVVGIPHTDNVLVNHYSAESKEKLVQEFSRFGLLDRNFPEGHINTINKRYLRRHIETYEKAKPRIDLLLLVRDQLPSLLQTYSKQNFESSAQEKLIIERLLKETLKLPIRGQEYSNTNDIRIYFQTTSDGVFQVDGIEPNRLALNRGREILFHTNGLAELKTFTFADAVQLWLHEVSHELNDMDISLKDKVNTSVSEWVKSRTTEFTVDPYKAVYAINLGESARMEDVKSLERQPIGWMAPQEPLDLWKKSVRSSLIVYSETFRGVEHQSEVYSGFATMDDGSSMTYEEMDFRKHRGEDILQWPLITIDTVKMNSIGKLVIEYSQKPIYYKIDPYQQRNFVTIDPRKNRVSDIEYPQFDVHPTIPDLKYRIDFDPQTKDLEANRLYKQDLADGYYELHREIKKEGRHFISLKVKSNELSSKSFESIMLSARDLDTGTSFSIRPYQFKRLSPFETQLHFEIKEGRLRLSDLFIPDNSAKTSYQELHIRPTDNYTVVSPRPAKNAQPKIVNLKLAPKKTKEDSVKIQIQLETDKKIKGFTFEIEHQLIAQNGRFQNPNQIKADYLADIFVGRKHFYAVKSAPSNIYTLELPDQDMSEYTKSNYEVVEKLSWAYTRRYNPSALTMKDLKKRNIKTVWAHLENGAVIKLGLDSFKSTYSVAAPDETIYRSAAEEQTARYAKYMLAQYGGNLPKEIDLRDEAPAQPAKAPKCINYFK